MNKRKKWGIIALVICVIGGIVMLSLNHQKEKTLEEKMRIEQDRMVLYLVNHYEGINEIEFNDKTDNYVISWNKRLNLQEKNEITNQQTIDNIKVKYWSK